MAIYDVSGSALTAAYDASGTELETAYDVSGNVIFELSPTTFSVLGDSYSAYTGDVYPSTNNIWYTGSKNGVTDKSMMWYRLYETASGNELLINNSYSGTPICYDGYGDGTDDAKEKCFIARMDNIGDPDIIFVLGGTNDSWIGVGVGEYKYADWEDADFVYFRPALAYLLYYLQTNHPNARLVFIKNTGLAGDISTSIDTICSYYNVDELVLTSITKTDGHPTNTGMQQICNQLVAFLA